MVIVGRGRKGSLLFSVQEQWKRRGRRGGVKKRGEGIKIWNPKREQEREKERGAKTDEFVG